MANEYSYEVLTKASTTIFQEVHEASSLTISTCKCGFFGGLSNLTSKNLQNAMEVE
jgi:hypothetical protein